MSLKVSFKVDNNFSSEFYAEDLKLMLVVESGVATITVDKFEEKIEAVNTGEDEDKTTVNKELLLEESEYIKKLIKEICPKGSNCEAQTNPKITVEGKPASEVLKGFELEPLAPVIDKAKPVMEKLENYVYENNVNNNRLNKENKECAELYSKIKYKHAEERSMDRRVDFVKLMDALREIPSAFKKYKDSEGKITIIKCENGKIYFYDSMEGKFNCLDKVNKKIYEVPKDEIEHKLNEQKELQKKYNEIQAKKQEILEESKHKKTSLRQCDEIAKALNEFEAERKNNKIKVISNMAEDITCLNNNDKKEKNNKDENKI